MDRNSRQIATDNYLRRRRRQRLVVSSCITLIAASVVATYAGAFGRCGDDWARFDHRTFRVIRAISGESLQIQLPDGETDTVELLGVASPDAAAQSWLTDRAAGREVTLLLQSPQTRDSSGRLLAFVFIDHSDLSVELVKAGLAFADRREKTVMDGLIDPAESDARKKKRGLWAAMTAGRMPEWRKVWAKSLPGRGGN